MPDPERAPTQCDQCEKTDTAPKWQELGGATKHFDCMSAREAKALRATDPFAGKLIDQATGGTRNDDLLAFIGKHGPKAEG